jgi:hypothetical protein
VGYLDSDDVQPWLETTKLTIGSIEAALESTFINTVFGRVSARYTTTTWNDEASTPGLVIQVVAMLYAAAFYRRQYSEDLEGDPAWPVWLEKTANTTLMQIVDGTIDLPVVIDPGVAGLCDPAAFSMSAKF